MLIGVKTSPPGFLIFQFWGLFFPPSGGKCHSAEQGVDSLVSVFLGDEVTPRIKHPSNQLFAPKSSFPALNRWYPQLFA